MSKTVKIRPILHSLSRQRVICSAAVENIIANFGEEPEITKRNLRRAVSQSNMTHYRNFCAEWLGWTPELTDYLHQIENNIMWVPTRAYWNTPFVERRKIVHEAHVAATLAWIKEMAKP
jgi:hypothetical protein